MSTLHLFEGYGIELEYMLIERTTARIAPVADALLREASGSPVPTSDHEDGDLAWSNELVQHVIELKTNGPAPRLQGLAAVFQDGVRRINGLLAPRGVRLSGGAMHPFMDPRTETVLWPHETTEVYHAYDRIFGCSGHGWSNLQSMHINLPFANDEEFARLHLAIRAALPLLPCLAASSPFADGLASGPLDLRMQAYARNSARIPSMAGRVVPEPVTSRAQYETEVLGRLYADLAPHDPEGLLRHEFANARGAIARFDRMAIEIRILDLQEHPAADLGIAGAVVALVRALAEERWAPLAQLAALDTEALAVELERSIVAGEEVTFRDPALLRALGRSPGERRGGTLWRELLDELQPELDPPCAEALSLILREGTLAARMLRRAGPQPSLEALRELVLELADCLDEGRGLHGR
ncbi:MAG: glutamate--cysteine ligase [Planctomycetes bacterium]|nr:glutamate--cysteine ligase [Planctomycetota bacterium]